MAGEVRSEADVWRLRAAAAEDAARELGGLASDLRRVLRRNYFGVDCVEGQALFDKLIQVTGQVAADFDAQCAELDQLSSRCTAAAAAYDEADVW
ncbi:hypothetical protein [Gordonia sp. PP30]|uniref:hypothetical protein n=1 Tax=unclassified Gordonia (in: high G+C Gram-positive bacteria) TaxID=2657482 RepID=UPI0020000734|nr:hypothetical protein [Gordonia sp. PP30]UQE76036.1 hypothetical protein MYK68_05430 [Gordonia sp. PP30]